MKTIKILQNSDGFKKFFVISPKIKSNHSKELSNCLKQLDEIISNEPENYVLMKIVVFGLFQTPDDYFTERQWIEEIIFEHFDDDIFHSIIPQSPADGSNISLEVMFQVIKGNKNKIEFGGFMDGQYLYYSNKGFKELHVFFPSISEDKTNTYEDSSDCFKFGAEHLEEFGFHMNNIVRQWMYLGNINKFENFEDKPTENYQMFNLARAKFYKECDWSNGYPSATGIGAGIKGSFLEFTAVKGKNLTLIVPLKNPQQIDAHSYTEKYVPSHERFEVSDNKPKFERGKAVLHGKFLEIYVSGTAAILGEDSLPGDIRHQTETTINNIFSVASKDNLRRSGIEIDGDLPQFSMARAYIKYPQDSQIVKEICLAKFGEIPITYVAADVCRKELLVEIEAYISFHVEAF